MWPTNITKSSKKHTNKPEIANSYTGVMASRLPFDFLSPSSSACIEICLALHTLQNRNMQLAWNEIENCNQSISKLAQAVEANTKAIEENGKAVAKMVDYIRRILNFK